MTTATTLARDYDMTIEQVIDREKIRDVLMRYVRGIDRRDADLLRTVYWPEAIDDHTLYVGKIDGFIDYFFDHYKDHVVTIHNIGSIIIDLEGDTARTESYFTYLHRRKVDGDFLDLMTAGRYIDRMEKRGREWRIAARTVTLDWKADERKMGDWDEGFQFPGSDTYPNDVIYTWAEYQKR